MLPGSADAEPQSVWVPSEDISFFRVPRPKVARGKWAQLLPWVIEEQVLQDVATLHIVPIGDLTTDEITVAVLENTILEQWLASCSQRNLDAQAFVPDVFSLPWASGEVTIKVESDRILVRSGLADGFSGDFDWVEHLLSQSGILQAAGIVNVYIDTDQELPEFLPEHAQRRAVDSLAVISRIDKSFNLLVGRHQPSSRYNVLPEWRLVMSAAALVFGLFVVTLWLDVHQSQNQLAAVNKAINDDYQLIFKRSLDGASANIRSIVAEQLEGTGGASVAVESAWDSIATLDQVLSDCDSCVLQTLEADSQATQLLLRTKQSASVKQKFDTLPGVRVQWRELAQKGSFEVSIRKRETF